MLKIGLRNRFLLYFLPLLLVILVQGGWNVRTFANVHRHFNALQKEETRNASAMLDLKKLLLSLETGIREQKFDQEVIREKANQLSSMIKQHAQHKHNGMTPEEEAAHEMLHHAIFATTLSQYLLEQSEKGWPSKKEELEQISEAIREERGHLENAIDEHLRLHIRQIDRTEAFVSQQYHHTLTVVVLTGFAVIALTLFVVFLMMRCVLGPMKILQEGTRQIGMGNLDHQVQINSGDEFEFLAQEFGKMAEQLASYHNEFDLKVKQRTSELLRANAELKELSGLVHIDGLTRVANRRYFDMRLCQEWKQLACERSSLAVIFVDLDYFKQYNDTYGHQAGDECLQKIAHMLQHNLRRPTDLAARYGGEEFILLLPRTDEAGAQQVAKNVEQALRKLRIPHERSAVGAYVTCSMGIAITIPTVDSSVDDLVAAADDALYQAKAWGRNQYVISEKLNSSAQQEVS